MKWTVSKGDLSVDTLIKSGIPTGCGYFVINPEKLRSVVEAAEAFAKAFF